MLWVINDIDWDQVLEFSNKTIQLRFHWVTVYKKPNYGKSMCESIVHVKISHNPNQDSKIRLGPGVAEFVTILC